MYILFSYSPASRKSRRLLRTYPTLIVVIKVVFSEELPSNVNIFSKLLAELNGVLHGQLWYGQEDVDLLCLLGAPQVF